MYMAARKVLLTLWIPIQNMQHVTCLYTVLLWYWNIVKEIVFAVIWSDKLFPEIKNIIVSVF